MTEKTFNYTKSYFGFQLGRVKLCTIFSCIFAILGFPLLVTSLLLDQYADFEVINNDIYAPLFALGVISIIGICAMSYITPLISLKHLYTKTKADNILSLPITGNQRFVIDILSSILPFAVPFLVSCGITAIIESFFPPFSYYFENISMYALKGFFCLIMFATLNIAVITACGRVAEAILYPIGLNIVLFGITALGCYLSIYNCVGISDTYTEVFLSPVVRIWPVGNAISIFMESAPMFYVYAIGMTVVFTALAYISYKKRRAENIGKTFVFKFSYPVASTIVALAFILLYVAIFDLINYNDYSGISITITVMCVILLIIMLILEVVNYKKINGILKFGVKYILTLGGGIAICFALAITDGFGIAHYIPSSSVIESAEISVNHYNSDYGRSTRNYITVYSEDAIKLITDEHKHIIDMAVEFDETGRHETTELEPYTHKTSDFYIYYTLKSGRRVSRTYYIYDEVYESEGFWENMYSTEDYRLQSVNALRDHRYYNITDMPKAFRLMNTHSDKRYFEAVFETDEQYKELLSALEADLKADLSYGRHNEAPVGNLLVGYLHRNALDYSYSSMSYYGIGDDDFAQVARITLYESYTNTLTVLGKYGTVPTKEQNLDDAVGDDEIFMLYRIKKNDESLTALESYNDYGGSAVFVTGEEFKELASHHVKYSVKTDDEYVYCLTRGMWDRLHYRNYSPDDFIDALAEIGVQYDNRSTFQSDYIYYTIDNNYDQKLHESVNGMCNELFDTRTVFEYTENAYYYQ